MRSHYFDPDMLFDQIRQGDRECCICGNPSYTMFRSNIYCAKHDPNKPIRLAQTNGDEAKGETNEQIHKSQKRTGIL